MQIDEYDWNTYLHCIFETTFSLFPEGHFTLSEDSKEVYSFERDEQISESLFHYQSENVSMSMYFTVPVTQGFLR
jgi:hypothetical protein